MTIREAQKICQKNGIVLRKTPEGDFRIVPKGFPESSACYESTIGDAIATARAMSGSMAQDWIN
jgi:hypothetical protein